MKLFKHAAPGLCMGLCLSLCTALSNTVIADTAITVKHYQKHERYAYGAQLLELALSKLDTPYEIRSPEVEMNEARGELEVISGTMDIQWMSTTSEREEKMIAVKIPIYRWILGLRLLLVQQERVQEMSKIRTLEDLQNYTGIHGKHWGDLPVYAANQLPVSAHVKYESLFQILEIGRVDYFHRGLNEIWGELDKHEDTLAIADNVMLFYPLPVYYFVTANKAQLASQVEKGLRMAMEDGSFKEHFLEFHEDFIEMGELESRTLITLRNPDLPRGTPAVDTSWWLSNSPEN